MSEQSMIERVARAMHAEEDRWRCITGGTGMQDVIVRDDDNGEPVEISRHPQGDGDMFFWDTRNRAVAAAAIKAMREPSEAMIDRFVSRALCVSISGEGGWSEYARAQWQTMIDAALVGEG